MKKSGFAEAADGTRMAWELRGEAGPTLVFCNGLANDPFQWGNLLDRLEGRARLLTWDYRGHGRSDKARDPGDWTMATTIRDLASVLDDAGIDQRVPLLGYSVGCQVVLEAWRHIPERISAIACVLGSYKRPLDTFFANGVYRRLAPWPGRISEVIVRRAPLGFLAGYLKNNARHPRMAHLTARGLGIVERRMPYRDFAPWYAQFGAMDPASFRAFALAAQEHDATDLLPTITVPVLVVTGGKDLFTPPHLGREVVEAVPDGELIHLPRASHSGIVGAPDDVCPPIIEFLDRRGLLRAG